MMISRENLVPVRWADVASGDKVYLAGVRNGEEVAYGPQTVKDPVARELVNSSGKTFDYRLEALLVKPATEQLRIARR